VLGQPDSVRLLDGADGRRIPAYDCPEAAAGAMARAAAYGTWRANCTAPVPAFPDVSADRARALVQGFLSRTPGGGCLRPGEATELLACYGIAPVPVTAVPSVDEAVAAAARSGGTEVLISVADDRMFGPLIVFGVRGSATDGLVDNAARLAPLTTTDADALINSVRAAPLLRGHRGRPTADFPPPARAALRDLLLRVSRLAEDVPEITELELNPVTARPDGPHIVDARIKVTPCQPRDPFLRKLR
jgi:hypothetical protein